MRQSSRTGISKVGLVVGLALLGGAGFFALRAGSGEDEEPKTLDERYRDDGRVSILIYDCPFGRMYDADTTQMNSILVSKMETGHRDPIRRFKQELADIGEAVVPELDRLYDRSYQHRFRAGVLQNVLDVCAMMKGPWGISIVRKGFAHPKESVRLSALDGLRFHGGPEDYESVALMLPFASSAKILADYGGALEALDKDRFYADLVQWLEDGEYSEMWPYAAPGVTQVTDSELVARFHAVALLRGGTIRPFLIAPAARDGQEGALNELRGMLADVNPSVVRWGIDALGRVGLESELYELFRDHEDAGLRGLAAHKIAEAKDNPETTEWLLEGLSSDMDPDVREVCMAELVARGSERALRQAYALLAGTLPDREAAMRALRKGWEINPESPAEAYGILSRVLAERYHNESERVALLQQIGLVPARECAEFLMDFALTHEGAVKGRDLHRWICGQVYNTGPAGRAILDERLAVETDPFRRLDLLSYIWQDHEDESRDILLAILTDPTKDEYERLYAADRLIRIGPASEIAPVLKRVYLDSTHRYVRPAYQCMLWTWYGVHDEPVR
ncbi:MAG: HEAT repeat domain-containing protein [bacterium]|nr:HEAT repeat domain-containing protein [bacterium]